MTRKLKVAQSADTSEGVHVSVADAVAGSRRNLLVALRKTVADTIDAGVPAHALARLAQEVVSLDESIRDLDAQADEESGGLAVVEDAHFDATAI